MLGAHPLQPSQSWFIQNCQYLGPWAEKLGPVDYALNPGTYEVLVHSVISQQLSGKAAATIHRRFVDLLAGKVEPERTLALSPEELQSVGVSRQKQGYLYDLSECFIRERSSFSRLDVLGDEDIIALLTQIKGIGVWTAQMYLIFSLGRPDVFPADDLGVKMGFQRVMNLTEVPGKKEMIQIAERWKPWRSAAAWYLWKIPKKSNSAETQDPSS